MLVVSEGGTVTPFVERVLAGEFVGGVSQSQSQWQPEGGRHVGGFSLSCEEEVLAGHERCGVRLRHGVWQVVVLLWCCVVVWCGVVLCGLFCCIGG